VAGVEVNYHTLANFRVAHLDFLDELLTHSVATLMEQELVDLSTHHRQDAYTAECVNALTRNRGLRQLLVRGVAKKAIALWYAIAHNLLRAVSLRAALAAPA
jgi:hypothetical protein